MGKKYLVYCLVFISCNYISKENMKDEYRDTVVDNITEFKIADSEKINRDPVVSEIDSRLVVTDFDSDSLPDQLVAFAKTLIGTPYKYASVNVAQGLDCSGFITNVFNHFGIIVPRSSVDFTNYGLPVNLLEAKSGDLILFTGTDSLIEIVGHMGIITENRNGEIKFIHSTSGKANGVTITTLNNYYRKRFVKVIRIPFYNK
jgi:cell wall-associated NlpC family hydrolase